MCIIDTFDDDTIHLIDEREVFHIAQATWMYDRPLMNITSGGEGGRLGSFHTEETKAKMSLAHAGEKNHFYGKTHTAEALAKMSAAVTGRKHTDEAKAKISEAFRGKNHPMFGKTQPEDVKAKIREARAKQVFSEESNKKRAVNAAHSRWHVGKGILKEGCARCYPVTLEVGQNV
jgi:hypothetical protein